MIKKAFLWILNIQQMREILANLEHKPKNIINYFFLSKYLEIKYQKKYLSVHLHICNETRF